MQKLKLFSYSSYVLFLTFIFNRAVVTTVPPMIMIAAMAPAKYGSIVTGLLTACVEVGVGIIASLVVGVVGVSAGFAVGVGVGEGEGLGVGVGEGLGVAVGVGIGEGVGVGVGVGAGEGDGVGAGVEVGVGEGVGITSIIL
jgi:hypothetical protein